MSKMIMLSNLGWDTIGVGSFAKVDDACGNLFRLAGTVLDHVTDNPILTLFFAAAVVPIAVGIVRRLKSV